MEGVMQERHFQGEVVVHHTPHWVGHIQAVREDGCTVLSDEGDTDVPVEVSWGELEDKFICTGRTRAQLDKQDEVTFGDMESEELFREAHPTKEQAYAALNAVDQRNSEEWFHHAPMFANEVLGFAWVWYERGYYAAVIKAVEEFKIGTQAALESPRGEEEYAAYMAVEASRNA